MVDTRRIGGHNGGGGGHVSYGVVGHIVARLILIEV